jgi:hypothetical protein
MVLDRERDEPLAEMHDVVPARRDGRAQLGREPRESLARPPACRDRRSLRGDRRRRSGRTAPGGS